MKNKKFYITTAVDYVNSSPHVGHAFEKVLADAIARWHKLNKEDVFFLTGVDENAQKNVEAAEKANVPVKEFVDKNTALFKELCDKLNISYDKFIRTSAKEHAKVVYKILNKIIKNKDIYKGKYEGYYCSGCEAFITEKDLVNGKCPEHGKEPEHRSEEAYFFKLSKYQKELLKIIQNYVTPKSRANEVLVRVKEGLNDLCISRKGVGWGIDFPEDNEYKIYVWIDALINYISGAEDKWPADLHVIGKGINWFHSVIWPALLLSAGYKLPKKLLVHGYLKLGDKKISKSLGNVIDPLELLSKYPTDSVRYSLLKCSVFEDSDFSEEILISRHNNELANKLGNLISRVSALDESYGIQKCENKLLKKINLKKIQKLIDNYELDKALNEIFAFIDICNEYVQSKKPWQTHDKKVLYELTDSIKAIAILLWPFIPTSCEKIAEHFGFEIKFKNISSPIKIKPIKKFKVLFEKIEDNKNNENNRNNKNNDKSLNPTPITPTTPPKNSTTIIPTTHPKNSTTIIPTTNPIEKINKSEKHENIITMEKIVEFREWEKIEIRVAEIKKIEDIEGADKLYKLSLDVGSLGQRIVCAGIKQYYTKEELKGKKLIYFANLKPRLMKGIESQGMILAAVSDDHSKVVLISPEKGIANGSRVS